MYSLLALEFLFYFAVASFSVANNLHNQRALTGRVLTEGVEWDGGLSGGWSMRTEV